jgi:hypothetical protein
MLRRVFRGLSKNPAGLTLIAGAIGVLTGVERLMSKKRSTKPLRPRTDYFEIKRTKSDVGYTYWVLHGFGRYSCFALFDTWREAMDEAVLRLQRTAVIPAAPAFVSASDVRFRPRASQNSIASEPVGAPIS